MLLRLVIAVATTAALGNVSAAMEVEKLAPGVYALLQPHSERFDDANSLVVIDADGVVVVDAQAKPDRVDAVIETIRGLTDAPVTAVINTHWHGDHTQGNAVYRDEFGTAVEFVGHATLVEDVPNRAAADIAERLARYEAIIPEAEAALAEGRNRAGELLDDEQRRQQRDAIDRARRWVERNRGARFIAPTRTYRCETELQAGATVLQLRHCDAHTRGDTVVWLPQQRILATGDLLDDLPYAGHGNPRGWIECLDAIAELDAAVYVPGHGPVLRDHDKLHAVRAFIASMLSHVEQSRADGLTLEQAVAAYDGTTHRDALAGNDKAAQRFFDATLEEGLTRTWETTEPPQTD